MVRRVIALASAAVLAVGLLVTAASAGSAGNNIATYEVTITNLADAQPISPPVAVTHRRAVKLFKPGTSASDAIEAIAEDGNQGVAVAALTGAAKVTDVVDVGAPLTPSGVTIGDFTDSITFEIDAHRRDRLSLAGMLICTNDGFVGLNSIKLPKASAGTVTHYLNAYDAGTEKNTELSEDIVDPCSGLGPVVLDGDPDGNNNDGIETDGVIRHHDGVSGTVGDLLAAHDWDDPVAMIEIRVVENAPNVNEYKVTLENLTPTQPLSPAVVATHNPKVSLYSVGAPASGPLEAIAENGDQSGAVAWLSGLHKVTDVVDVGAPLTPYGVTVGDFTDTAEFYIYGRNSDQFSLASMLICTNDGLAAANRLALPRGETLTYYVFGYDAGTEANSELSSDIVDPCSLLGPVTIGGDPDGNSNAGDTDGVVAPHPGISGSYDLLDAHNWDGPVLKVTISN